MDFRKLETVSSKIHQDLVRIPMKPKRSGYSYFFFGILCGFLIGTSLDDRSSLLISGILFVSAIFFFIPYLLSIESDAHSRHMEVWKTLRLRGKWYFIFTRYVVLRAGVYLTIMIGPAYAIARFSIPALGVLALFSAPLIGFFIYSGNKEWNDCQQETEIRSLIQEAECMSYSNN